MMSWSGQGVSRRPRCDELEIFRRATTRYQCCKNEIMQSEMELDDPAIETALIAGQFERCDYPFSTYEHPTYEDYLPQLCFRSPQPQRYPHCVSPWSERLGLTQASFSALPISMSVLGQKWLRSPTGRERLMRISAAIMTKHMYQPRQPTMKRRAPPVWWVQC